MSDPAFYDALLRGQTDAVVKELDRAPEAVNVSGGPNSWPPLAYVCTSRHLDRAAILRTAKLLLERGADPNAVYVDQNWPDNPLPVLYAATGLNNDPELARALLDAGAKPEDGESLYHSTEHPDLRCLRLLLEYGGSASSFNVLHHMLDREDPAGARLLLSAGANPNQVNGAGGTALHWAVWRGRSAAIVSMLLDAGAHINEERADGRTAYSIAFRSGQKAICELLAARGAHTSVPAIDEFAALCARSSPEEIESLVAERFGSLVKEARTNPAIAKTLPDLAGSHQTAAVRGLLLAGFPINARGEHGATALHWSCWKGYADLVKLLLEEGASLTIEDEVFHGTPQGWAEHGRENCGEDNGDYAEVMRLLSAANPLR